jgi:hypothetical protein
MADSRDITGKNRKFTGTTGVKLPEGTSAQRVDEAGQLRFNTTTNLAEYYDGTDWKSIDAPPTITGFTLDGGSVVTSAEMDEDAAGDATLVISGSNFDITSGTVVFEPESGGANVATQTITRTNSSSFTVTVTRGDFVQANGPYAIKLTNGSGLAATLASALTTSNEPPVFTESAGNLGSAFNTVSATFDGGATDADGDTITYSISSGALPTGLSINSSTGSITGTPSGNALGDYTFTVLAATDSLSSTREFTITIADLPSGGSISTSGDYRIHSFTSSADFVNTKANLSVEYLIVAGGGGGGSDAGGGGGAGGMRTGSTTLVSTGNYTATVGAGGATGGGGSGPSCPANDANQGSSSSFNGISSTGGGKGGMGQSRFPCANAGGGGSGGGGGGTYPSNNNNGSGGSGTAGQGNNGSPGQTTPETGGAGGGKGSAGSGVTGGNGGSGIVIVRYDTTTL